MASSRSTRTKAVTPFELWPPIDRELFTAGTTWDPDGFRRPYASRIRPRTLEGAQYGHGRLLSVMIEKGILDPLLPPAERLTREVADTFLAVLRKPDTITGRAANANSTIKLMFWQVRSALKIMQPKVDTTWLTKPGQWSLHELLPSKQRHRDIIGIATLYSWGIKMMQQSAREPTVLGRCRALRNGLIIAVLTSRAPRLRTLASIRGGEQFKIIDDSAWLMFSPDDVKTRRRIEYELPPELLPWIKRYIEVERVELIGGRNHNAFWVASNGAPLEMEGIQQMIRRATVTEFGKSFGPHHFRHELASALAKADPDNPGLAAAVLAISPDVADRYYTHARDADAFARLAQDLDDERERTRLLAQRLWGDDP